MAVDINGAGDWSASRSATTRSTQAAAGQMPKVDGLTVTDATGSITMNGRPAHGQTDVECGVRRNPL